MRFWSQRSTTIITHHRSYTHIFLFLMRSTLAGGEQRDETGRAAAFINREIDRRFQLCGRKQRGGKRTDLAGCPYRWRATCCSSHTCGNRPQSAEGSVLSPEMMLIFANACELCVSGLHDGMPGVCLCARSASTGAGTPCVWFIHDAQWTGWTTRSYTRITKHTWKTFPRRFRSNTNPVCTSKAGKTWKNEKWSVPSPKAFLCCRTCPSWSRSPPGPAPVWVDRLYSCWFSPRQMAGGVRAPERA